MSRYTPADIKLWRWERFKYVEKACTFRQVRFHTFRRQQMHQVAVHATLEPLSTRSPNTVIWAFNVRNLDIHILLLVSAVHIPGSCLRECTCFLTGSSIRRLLVPAFMLTARTVIQIFVLVKTPMLSRGMLIPINILERPIFSLQVVTFHFQLLPAKLMIFRHPFRRRSLASIL